MAVINNLQQYHAAIAAVCPIVGVDATGFIFFDPSATTPQKTAAQNVAATYTDVPPQIMSIDLAVSRMTDPEFTALYTFASTRPNVLRVLHHIKTIDLSQSQVQTMIQALVTAAVLTQARANVVFVAPAPPSIAPVQPLPQPPQF